MGGWFDKITMSGYRGLIIPLILNLSKGRGWFDKITMSGYRGLIIPLILNLSKDG